MANHMLSINSKYHHSAEQLSREEKQIKAAKRDRSKFGVLYNKYYEQIYLFIFARIESEDTVADLTSQVFLKAMLSLERYEFRGLPFSSWLYRIAQNELRLFYRSRKSKRIVSADSEDLIHLLEDFKEEEKEREIDLEGLVFALRQLPPDDVELIEMRYFEKRPFKEVAEILEITENNAKVKTYRIPR